jgi:hypothetical protein
MKRHKTIVPASSASSGAPGAGTPGTLDEQALYGVVMQRDFMSVDGIVATVLQERHCKSIARVAAGWNRRSRAEMASARQTDELWLRVGRRLVAESSADLFSFRYGLALFDRLPKPAVYKAFMERCRALTVCQSLQEAASYQRVQDITKQKRYHEACRISPVPGLVERLADVQRMMFLPRQVLNAYHGSVVGSSFDTVLARVGFVTVLRQPNAPPGVIVNLNDVGSFLAQFRARRMRNAIEQRPGDLSRELKTVDRNMIAMTRKIIGFVHRHGSRDYQTIGFWAEILRYIPELYRYSMRHLSGADRKQALRATVSGLRRPVPKDWARDYANSVRVVESLNVSREGQLMRTACYSESEQELLMDDACEPSSWAEELRKLNPADAAALVRSHPPIITGFKLEQEFTEPARGNQQATIQMLSLVFKTNPELMRWLREGYVGKFGKYFKPDGSAWGPWAA